MVSVNLRPVAGRHQPPGGGHKCGLNLRWVPVLRFVFFFKLTIWPSLAFQIGIGENLEVTLTRRRKKLNYTAKEVDENRSRGKAGR